MTSIAIAIRQNSPNSIHHHHLVRHHLHSFSDDVVFASYRDHDVSFDDVDVCVDLDLVSDLYSDHPNATHYHRHHHYCPIFFVESLTSWYRHSHCHSAVTIYSTHSIAVAVVPFAV